MPGPSTLESDALVPILEGAQVPHDGVLVVHSAIAALSRQGFRAEAMIEVLLDYLGAGTLVMPTMTWRTVTPASPYWDELVTPSHTGVLTEVFRASYATHRSIHPTHSVAARGTLASQLVARHHLDDTPVSANSPYGLMDGYSAYVLMLGVGLETCTAIHLPEETVAPDLYLRPREQAELYQCRDRLGRDASGAYPPALAAGSRLPEIRAAAGGKGTAACRKYRRLSFCNRRSGRSARSSLRCSGCGSARDVAWSDRSACRLT